MKYLVLLAVATTATLCSCDIYRTPSMYKDGVKWELNAYGYGGQYDRSQVGVVPSYHAEHIGSQLSPLPTVYVKEPVGPTVYKHLPASPTVYKTLPTVPTVYKNLPAFPTDYKNLPAVPTVYKSLPAVQTVYKNLPAFPTDYKNLPAVPTVYKSLPAVQTVYKNLPAFPTDYKNLPVLPTAYKTLPALPTVYKHQPAIPTVYKHHTASHTVYKTLPAETYHKKDFIAKVAPTTVHKHQYTALPKVVHAEPVVHAQPLVPHLQFAHPVLPTIHAEPQLVGRLVEAQPVLIHTQNTAYRVAKSH